MDGEFAGFTHDAVKAFQADRSIDVDGICGPQTWALLVEAGQRLGGRLLYLHRPALRGDDVAELQRLLSTLGFSVGRIDGIHDARTAHAVTDFQRNAGLVADGICGPDTLVSLDRFVRHLRGAEDMAAIEERERLTAKGIHLADRRVAIGERGGLDAMTAAIRRALTDAGAEVLTVHHPDWSAQAQQVNGYEADVYLSFEVRPEPPVIAFFQGEHFVSPGGRLLAERLCEALHPLFPTIRSRGMRLPMLRETRMPAVLCRFERARDVVRHNRDVAAAVATATEVMLTTAGVDL